MQYRASASSIKSIIRMLSIDQADARRAVNRANRKTGTSPGG
jgi:hypothetical protein